MDNLYLFILPTIIAVISLAVLLVIRSITFRIVRRWAYTFKTDTDEIIIGAVRSPSFYWIVSALGVAGLAVALALRDTLANLFAGIHLLVEKSVCVSDFIKLETGEEGYKEY